MINHHLDKASISCKGKHTQKSKLIIVLISTEHQVSLKNLALVLELKLNLVLESARIRGTM